MITVDEVAAHLGFAATPADTEALQRVLDAAHGVIDPHLTAGVDPHSIQQSQTYDLCLLRACSELWAWQSTPGGQVQFADGSTGPAPVMRDVYRAVQPTLAHAGLVAKWVVA